MTAPNSVEPAGPDFEKQAREMVESHEMEHLGARVDRWGLCSTIAAALRQVHAAGFTAGKEAERRDQIARSLR